VEQLRQQQAALSEVVKSDAAVYARSVSDQSPERFAKDVRAASADLVRTYGPVSAEASALFYETQRPSPGGRVVMAPTVLGETWAADLAWAFVPMFTPDRFTDPLSDVQERVGAVVAREVLRIGRDTVAKTQAADTIPGGVARYARPGACGFCAYMSAIDADVSEDTIWHRNCTCVTVPWWEDNPFPASSHMDEYADASEWARRELERRQREMKAQYPGMRRRNFFRQFPELAINTRNLSGLVRERLGLEH